MCFSDLYFSFKSLRTASNVFIVNLALADLIMTVIDFPMFFIACFLNDWPFGYYGCQLYATLTGLAGLVTINTLAVIALDRYQAVVRRVNQLVEIVPRRTVAVAIGCIWMYSLIWSISPVLGWSRYHLEGVLTSCTFNFLSRDVITRSFIFSITIGEFVIPILIIIWAYANIIFSMVLRRKDLAISNSSDMAVSLRLVRQRYRLKSEIKTSCIMVGLVCLFVVSWLPYTMVAFVGQYGNKTLITPYVSSIPGVIAKTSTVSNPLVYAIIHPKFKTKIKSLFNNTKGNHILLNKERKTVSTNGDKEITVCR
ncbi:hypothetical protein KUTeg_002953 [Tegillarca granosa]|uniref:G-protein coupled receptors family 1 profile domain-containing protein n=1 Tax=Tegillarca granosa TaxID=220873 RepID=A0ABQ9FPJ8_TEGGR|nr:hypothetical protein KUTeg_002953 [Tegillarca granosa]